MARGGKKKHAHLFLSEDRTEGESARQVTPSRTSNQLERGSCLAQLVELKPCRVNERSAPAERDDDDDTKTMKWAGRGGEYRFVSMSRNFSLRVPTHYSSKLSSRMCLIRRYLNARPVANTIHHLSLGGRAAAAAAASPPFPLPRPVPLLLSPPPVSGVYARKPLLPKTPGFP